MGLFSSPYLSGDQHYEAVPGFEAAFGVPVVVTRNSEAVRQHFKLAPSA